MWVLLALLSLWTLVDGVEAPESIYHDPQSGFTFVSNVAGEGNVKDGRGWIQKVSSAGEKVSATKWVEGLDAPKGMRAKDGVLWVTDIDRLVAIDIGTGAVQRKIEFPGAEFLNDVAIDTNGDVYVSDTLARVIYRVRNGTPEVFVSGDETESPNGLLIEGGKLIVAAWGLAAKDWSSKVPGRLYSIDLKTKTKTLITSNPLGNLDGLESLGGGRYLVSDWMAGKVYLVDATGAAQSLEIASERGVADIGYDAGKNLLLVPYMLGNKVMAYELVK